MTQSRFVNRREDRSWIESAEYYHLALAALGVKLYQQEHVREAVVTAGQVDVLSGPGENYLLEFTVHEGTTLTVEEERGDWWRVRLWGDLEGWAQKAGLREV